MNKKALVLASVASMIDQFNLPNLEILQSLGYQVDVIANFVNPGNISEEQARNLQKRLKVRNVRVFHVDIPRSMNPFRILNALKKVKRIINQENYDLIHCHSPIGGVIGRVAASAKRKKGTKVIYTAHGFHFYKGAPLKNWLFFFPIEYCAAFLTDILITINKEDYVFAKKHLHSKSVKFIPGVGIDTILFRNIQVNKKQKRKEIGVPQKAFLILSVGELNENKNHLTVIKAIAALKNLNIHYIIAGKGALREYLLQKIKEMRIENQVHLLGFRNDIPELMKCSDLYVLPSIREGLNVSLMEAMASGLPCVVSKIRGNIDLINEKEGGYLCKSKNINEFAGNIKRLSENSGLCKKMGEHNQKKMETYDVQEICIGMCKLYREVFPEIR